MFLRLLSLIFILGIGVVMLPAQQSNNEEASIDDEVVVLPEFEVKGDSIGNQYLASEAVSAGRTGEKIVDTPFAVQAITENLINDFQLFDEDEVLGLVGGAVNSGVATRIRGFAYRRQVDGVNAIYAMPLPSAMLKQLEVVKGAQSTSYGDSAPGGIINRVAKRPGTRFAGEMRLIAGTDNYRDALFTSTGPVAKSFLGKGKLYYRAYAQYIHQRGAVDIDYLQTDRYYAGGTLLWVPKKGTSFSLTAAFQKDRNRAAVGNSMNNRLTYYPTGSTSANASDTSGMGYDRTRLNNGNTIQPSWRGIGSVSLQDPNALYEVEYKGLSGVIEHRIKSNLSGKLFLSYVTRNLTHEGWQGGASFYEDTGRTSRRTPAIVKLDRYSYVAKGDLVWNTRTGGVKHKLLIGSDFVYRNDENPTYKIPDNIAQLHYGNDAIWLDLSNPYYARVDRKLATDLALETKREEYNASALAYLISDFFRGRLKTTVSGRYQWYDTTMDARAANKRLLNGSRSDDKLTYSVGLNYHIIGSSLVFYAGAGTGFDLSGLDVDEGMLTITSPTESRSVEFGFKGDGLDILGSKLYYTLSFFDVSETGRLTNPSYESSVDQGTGLVPQYINDAKTVAKGIELDTTWVISKAFTLKLGGAAVDSEVERNSAARLENLPATSTAKWTGFIIASYAFQNSLLKGLRIGGTGIFQSKRTFAYGFPQNNGVNYSNGTILGTEFIVNAYLAYSFKTGRSRHELRLLVRNATDKLTYDTNGRRKFGREYRFSYNLRF